jgi:hypothetical protein
MELYAITLILTAASVLFTVFIIKESYKHPLG